METSNKIVLAALWLMVVAVIASTAYLFLYKKSYNFAVEAACDPKSESCFHRDCSAADNNCPPSNIEDYKIYKVRASDFSKCSDNSCLKECESGQIACTQVKCGDSAADSCSANPEQSAQ